MFTLSTDTSCDVFRTELDRLGVFWVPLTYIIGAQTNIDDFSSDDRYTAFYNKIREGIVPSTSQINAFLHEEFFNSMIAKGASQIVHLTLSSGLSATYASALSGAEASMRAHPTVKIYVVDTLSATQGHRALLDTAIEMRDSGVSAIDTYNELNEQRNQLQHWILVDDLMHLKRGGRVNALTAHIGTMLNLKPILIINNEGKLAVVHKSKGFKGGILYFNQMLELYGNDINNQTVYIASADAGEFATTLQTQIQASYSCKTKIGWIGPVIGSHTGAGTLGLVFKSKKRLNNK